MNTTTNGFKFHADGTLLENPIGAQVTYEMDGRTLLGDVVGFHAGRNALTGLEDTWLIVRHFNGERWPVQPQAKHVTPLERTYEAAGRLPTNRKNPHFTP